MVRNIAVSLAAIAALVTPTSASAAIWTFSLTGYGATVAEFSGSFAGDAGADNILSFGELTDFTGSFAGHPDVSDFTLSRLDVDSFSYDTTTGDFTGLTLSTSGAAGGVGNLPGACSVGLCGLANDNVDFASASGPGSILLAAPGVPAPLLGAGLIPTLAAFGGLVALGLRRRRRVLTLAC